jgi:hypothetical protein
MSTKPKSTARVLVALNFPSIIAAFIVFAKTIYKAMYNNSNFTGSATRVATLNTDIIALDTAETNCNSVPPSGTVATRNAALETVKADIRFLRNDVQTASDANPAKAETIIISAGMAVKKSTTHGKQQNTAKDGTEEGTVILTAEGPGPHEWRESTDEKTWALLPSGMTSKTTVAQLTSGTVYFFQNRQMLTNGEKSEWSQSVKIRVK